MPKLKRRIKRLDGRDEILSVVQRRSPESVSPAGYVFQRGGSAIVQADSVNAGEMTATFVIVSRESRPNRHGNMVQITESKFGRGLVTDQFEKNPVVLFDHGLSGIALPVGLSSPPKRQKTKATATVSFSKLPHAEPVFAAVAENILRMASIGFDPLKAMLVKQEKEKLEEGVETLQYWRGLDFVETELTEWSITPIGADRGSLKQALDRGKIHDCKLPPFMRYSFEQAIGEKVAWSPGWTEPKPKTEPQSAAPATVKLTIGEATIEGPAADVERIAQQFRQPGVTVVAPNLETLVDAEAPNNTTATQQTATKPRAVQLADAFERRDEQRRSTMQRLENAVMQRIDSAVGEVQRESQELQRTLDQRLGRVTAETN